LVDGCCFDSCAEQSCVGRLRRSFSRKCGLGVVLERIERGEKGSKRRIALPALSQFWSVIKNGQLRALREYPPTLCRFDAGVNDDGDHNQARTPLPIDRNASMYCVLALPAGLIILTSLDKFLESPIRILANFFTESGGGRPV
jgi:hypothetical protein